MFRLNRLRRSLFGRSLRGSVLQLSLVLAFPLVKNLLRHTVFGYGTGVFNSMFLTMAAGKKCYQNT